MAWLGTLIIITIPLFMIWNRLVIDQQRKYMEWLMSVLMLINGRPCKVILVGTIFLCAGLTTVKKCYNINGVSYI